MREYLKAVAIFPSEYPSDRLELDTVFEARSSTEQSSIAVAISGREYLGPYHLLKLIRAGKATLVWEAFDPDNHRIAIKVLQRQHCNDKVEVASLRHEYTVGRELNHPNVNRILEFNVTRGMAYVAMDFFDGLNLKQSIRQSAQLVAEQYEHIVRQAGAGLQHLHEHDWVHCDVKPDNFLLDEKGDVRLIDFSIATKVKKGLARILPRRSRVQGTRSYMSPEQIRGAALDPRSDVYSFGCVVYELGCGKLPYTGVSADDLLNRHLRAPIPPLSAATDRFSQDFSDLVASMMAKKADQRPKSIAKVIEMLDDIRIHRRKSSA